MLSVAIYLQSAVPRLVLSTNFLNLTLDNNVIENLLDHYKDKMFYKYENNSSLQKEKNVIKS